MEKKKPTTKQAWNTFTRLQDFNGFQLRKNSFCSFGKLNYIVNHYIKN
jgi:hypothetical protein